MGAVPSTAGESVAPKFLLYIYTICSLLPCVHMKLITENPGNNKYKQPGKKI